MNPLPLIFPITRLLMSNNMAILFVSTPYINQEKGCIVKLNVLTTRVIKTQVLKCNDNHTRKP